LDYDAVMADPPQASLGYAAGVVVVSLSTATAWFVFGQTQLADVVMVFLLGVVVVSMRFGYGPSLLAAVLSVVSFEFFFIPPLFSFAVSDLRHIVTFAVMFTVAFVVSHLTKRIRDQADAAHRREGNTASLYALSREIGLADSREALLESAARHVREVFDAKVAVFLPVHGSAEGEEIEAVLADEEFMRAPQGPENAASWAWRHQRRTGAGTDLLPSATALFVPLKGSRGPVGVLGLLPATPGQERDVQEMQLLETFAGLIGSALERTALVEEARQATLRAETEQLRNALLSSVSHDLRTPLAVVTGATSALLGDHAPTDEAKRRTLIMTAHEEAQRLNRLVRNLLDMTRLDAGALKVRKELQPLEEVVGAALNRLDDRLRGRHVGTSIPSDLPLVPFDGILIEQVLINLVENAIKHTPPGSPIDVRARELDGEVEIEVADRGPGVDRVNEERVFEKFFRAQEGEGGGVGLGLTICRGIVSAHVGRIWVQGRPEGGASFRFTLPLDHEVAAPPPLVAEVCP
jgi:two-component system, OmpR family, sensor histidine kinase KdpD